MAAKAARPAGAPPVSFGQRKYAQPKQRPSGYSSAAASGGVSPSLAAAEHPAIAGPPPASPAALADRDLSGIGNPLGVRPDLPATKTLIAEGKKTHQQLGKIMTNTWVGARASLSISLSCAPESMTCD